MNMAFAEVPAMIGRYLLTLKVTDYLDIAIMAFVVYNIFRLVESTKAASLLKGLFVFFAVLIASSLLQLNGINFILSSMVEIGVLALVILFQPEIRRILEEMGSRRFIAFFSHGTENVNVLEQTIGQTVLACTEMSQTRTGALIVFEREILLEDMIRSGTVLDAAVSNELLKNIFFVKAPMHDGAVIVRHGRVKAAGCMLPLSKNVNLSRDLGMRHRAGIGMSENSDAVIVIVSEESGSISVATGGMLKRHLKPETLENLLRNELLPQDELGEDKQKFSFSAILNLIRAKQDGGADDE
jgi:diadenylate cyclase